MLTFGPHRFDDDLLVMAIINRTPDSFYDRGATYAQDAALDRVDEVVAQGAQIVDIGGVKAGPGQPVDAEEEKRRVVSFVAEVAARYPDLVISVDTWRAEIGEAVCQVGATLLNDAWGGHDPALAEVAARYGVGLVCTHAGGLTPRTRPHRVHYPDIMAAVLDDVLGQAERAVALGVPRSGILIDPGHDFGKNTRHSLECTRRLPGDGRNRLAGAGLAEQQGLHRRDARPAGGRAPGRDACDHRRVGLAGCARLPGARSGARPSTCCTWCRRSPDHASRR